MRNETASLLISSSPSSSSSTPRSKYDVFLSFKGEDTRNKFTDHLYTALDKKGIVAFRDDKKLERGKAIKLELSKVIEESRFSIVIFSRNYASSGWCLDELVKIVECKNKNRLVVLPVFYDVDPSEVRKQTGSFQEDFAKHEQAYREKVQEWRTAMTEVGNISGWDLKDGSEAKLVQDIVKEIWCQLSCTFPSVIDDLVGIDSRLKELNVHIGKGLNDVRFIGIYGMRGIGKTTIARVVYERSHQFESRCFLTNVKEVSEKSGLVSLQNQLLSKILEEPNINISNVFDGANIIRSRLRSKKVLIILDNVDDSKQLNMLAKDCSWFGPGSRIIITTTNEHLLRVHGVDKKYKVEELDDNESLMLFSYIAFKLYHPARDYEELSMRVINYAGGLPLALEVLGSFLCGKSVDVWKSALDRLDKYPNRNIQDILQVSFDGLEELEKKIFLDIACFFNGTDKDYVTAILDACGFHSGIGIQVLIDKSLIKMLENKLWMHNLLQIMGREIVHRECIEEPGKRSRLWNDKDIDHVLMKNTGTDAVETIVIDLLEHRKAQWNADSFSKMSKLRLLKIHNVHLYEGPKCLSNELRFLEWHGYPSTCLPFSFHPDKLVELNMCSSGIKQLWKKKEALENLKFITLSHSQNLNKTPDFTGIPNLERLILEGCTSLCEVHQSIGLLRKLIFLNLKDCRSLKSLPSSICGLKSLKSLILFGCCKLQNLPENLGLVECLEVLDVSGTAVRQLPNSISLLKNLKLFYFRGYNGPPSNSWQQLFRFLLFQKSLELMPLIVPSLSGLCSLIELDLSDCKLGEGAIPNDIGCLSSLRLLNLSSNNFVSLPTSISQLSQLYELNVENCKRLQSLPEFSSNLEFVEASACTSLEMLANPLINSNTCGTHIYCHGCFKLVENQGYNNLATRMLKRYLQGANRRGMLDIVIPGNKIPEWFSYKTEGNKVTLQSSPLLNIKSKLIGFSLCSYVVVHQHLRGSLRCSIKADGRISFLQPTVWFTEKLGQDVSDHLWLLYLSLQKLSTWIRDIDRANRIGFSIISDSLGLEVKRFGVRPVYEQDVVELNQKMNHYSSQWKFNDFSQDFDGSAALDCAMIKRINDEAGYSGSDWVHFKDDSQDFDGAIVINEEAGPSGSDWFNWILMGQYSKDDFVDAPHPERVQCFKHL